GKRVLFIKQLARREYAYSDIGADGKGENVVMKTTVVWDDLFTSSFGSGIWSPDGKRFAALTTTEGKTFREGGSPMIVICDLAGKTTPLPAGAGATLGAVFANDGSLYYVDSPPLQKRELKCTLRRLDADGKKAKIIMQFDDGLLSTLTMSPDRSRIGGILATRNAEGKQEWRLWAYDIGTAKAEVGPSARFDDYFYDGGAWLLWGREGKILYCNGAEGERKSPFSIYRFAPFAKTKPATNVLQRNASYITVCAPAPGKLSVFSSRDKKSRVLDTKTNKVSDPGSSLFLIDKQGSVGLFADLAKRTLSVAKVVDAQADAPDAK
ncbi:MAG: hypothetical protein QGD94_05420, partial [Planctomycetia bacterium]|nr:hypothetical protein [Planctomycetia bacterium]